MVPLDASNAMDVMIVCECHMSVHGGCTRTGHMARAPNMRRPRRQSTLGLMSCAASPACNGIGTLIFTSYCSHAWDEPADAARLLGNGTRSRQLSPSACSKSARHCDAISLRCNGTRDGGDGDGIRPGRGGGKDARVTTCGRFALFPLAGDPIGADARDCKSLKLSTPGRRHESTDMSTTDPHPIPTLYSYRQSRTTHPLTNPHKQKSTTRRTHSSGWCVHRP